MQESRGGMGYLEKKKRGTQMNMTYEQFNEQMDVVGEAITTMLNDNAECQC